MYYNNIFIRIRYHGTCIEPETLVCLLKQILYPNKNFHVQCVEIYICINTHCNNYAIFNLNVYFYNNTM